MNKFSFFLSLSILILGCSTNKASKNRDLISQTVSDSIQFSQNMINRADSNDINLDIINYAENNVKNVDSTNSLEAYKQLLGSSLILDVQNSDTISTNSPSIDSSSITVLDNVINSSDSTMSVNSINSDSVISTSQTIDSRIAKTDTTKTEKSDSMIRFISTSNVNFREEPNTDSKVILQFSRNDKVTLIEETEEWKKVSFKEFEGWVYGTFVTKTKKVNENPSIENYVPKILDFNYEKTVEYETNKRVKVKGIYITKNIAAHSRFNDLLAFADTSVINAFVVDVKDDEGRMLFTTDAAEKYAPKANKKRSIKDIKAFMKKMENHNIYPIARIVCFKDPIYVADHPEKAITNKETGELFQSRDGLHWASAYDRSLWDYNISVAIEAAKAGFREIQFDYVRFPAYSKDETLDFKNSLNESKVDAIHQFLKTAYDSLSKYSVYLSADVFGLITSNNGLVGIGQRWEEMSSVVDYMCPMMYPSHYYNGSYGVEYPDTEPYNIIYRGVRDARKKNKQLKYPAIIRPWIQDFTAIWLTHKLRYGPEEIKLQIKAINDNGLEEFILWNARNVYSAKGLDKKSHSKTALVAEKNDTNKIVLESAKDSIKNGVKETIVDTFTNKDTDKNLNANQ